MRIEEQFRLENPIKPAEALIPASLHIKPFKKGQFRALNKIHPAPTKTAAPTGLPQAPNQSRHLQNPELAAQDPKPTLSQNRLPLNRLPGPFPIRPEQPLPQHRAGRTLTEISLGIAG